jgi:hypothetical protein
VQQLRGPPLQALVFGGKPASPGTATDVPHKRSAIRAPVLCVQLVRRENPASNRLASSGCSSRTARAVTPPWERPIPFLYRGCWGSSGAFVDHVIVAVVVVGQQHLRKLDVPRRPGKLQVEEPLHLARRFRRNRICFGWSSARLGAVER